MNRALEIAWARPIRRFWVHTCTLDHPGALPLYVRTDREEGQLARAGFAKIEFEKALVAPTGFKGVDFDVGMPDDREQLRLAHRQAREPQPVAPHPRVERKVPGGVRRRLAA